MHQSKLFFLLPIVGQQIETPPFWLNTVKAPTSGTKWHNKPGTKKWHEAKSDLGHTYYWNVDTKGKKTILYLKINPIQAKSATLSS